MSKNEGEVLDLEDRDPQNLNRHIEVTWEHLIGEPHSIRSPECAWSLSQYCFKFSRLGIYTCLSVLCAPIAACLVGTIYALFHFQMLLVSYYREYVPRLVWKNIFKMLFFHFTGLFAIYGILRGSAKLQTLLFDYVLGVLTSLSFTAGAHRLWSHRSYKARWPLRLFLACLNFLMYGSPIIAWAIEHRTHHKYSETDADPHDATRGLFFSQIGWLMLKQKPEVREKSKGIPKSDLYDDPILRWQEKYYMFFMPLVAFVLPTLMPMYFWNETFAMAYSVNILRYLTVFHILGLINSVAHIYGDKPYDRHIKSGDNLSVSALTLGEGLHNFHHTFPSDYQSAEIGTFSFNMTKCFIDICAKIGLAYDRKTTSQEMIRKRAARTGNGSHLKDL